MSDTYKDRELSITEFFKQKQLEYLSYKLRSLIYRGKVEYKSKFEEISQKIKEDIISISLKKNFKSIFNDMDLREEYLERFFPKVGLPKLQYKDEYQKNVKGHWDKIYWFSYSATLKQGNCIGVCNFVDTKQGIAKVDCDGVTKDFYIKDCERLGVKKYINKMF